MKRQRNIWIAGVLLVSALFLFLHCSKKGNSSDGYQPPKIVQMPGTLSFPDGFGLSLAEVTVGFGDDEKPVDSSGVFTINGKEHTPGLAMAQDQDGVPMLLGIVADPQSGMPVALDVHSTAVALAFLNPIVCISNMDESKSALQHLEALPELADAEYLLSLKLAENPRALAIEDEEIDAAISQLVLAYLNSYPEELAKRFPPPNPQQTQPAPKQVAGGPEIYPYTTVSGLKLTWEGGDKFRITNAYGRWAWCCTPDDSFFIFPNGDFLDVLKGAAWAPSKRDFDMHVVAGEDTSYVDVLSYGFSGNPANAWDSLSEEEQELSHTGGITTVAFEMVVNMISVITNTPRIYSNEKVAALWGASGWDFILRNARYSQRAVEYIKANDPWGLSWWLTKQIISEFTMSPAYREFMLRAIGMSITEGALTRLACWVAVPLKVAVAFNSVTSVMKTAMALTTAHFATSFSVWREFEDFGSVRGQVANKNSGIGISGATVVLTGDEGNPMSPAHQVTTDAGGNYLFTNIGVGEKGLTASKSGYMSNTVMATIEKDKTVTANVPLEIQAGGLSGRVLNDIFVHNSITPTTFRGTLDMVANEVSGNHRTHELRAYDGSYSATLESGTWWVVVSREDYVSDSFSVVISGSGNVLAPRDLVLKPHPTITGTVEVDRNNDGRSEHTYTFDFPQVGLTKPLSTSNSCPTGGSLVPVMDATAMRGYTQNDFDFVTVGFNTSLITGADVYNFGGIEQYGCQGVNVSSSTTFGTSREICSDTLGHSSPMLFLFVGMASSRGCNCGIVSPGRLYLETWGTAVGDSVFGSYTADLAASNTCSCSGSDTDQDGLVDSWTVSCARVRVEMTFRLFVGTDYLMTANPSTFLPR